MRAISLKNNFFHTTVLKLGIICINIHSRISLSSRLYFLHCVWQIIKVHVISSYNQYFIFSVFWISVSLIVGYFYHIAVLIGISLITNDVDHVFISLFAICYLWSSVCSKSLPIFKIGVSYCWLFFFNKFIYLFLIYFWLCWVFVAAHRLSLVETSRGYSTLRCMGFSLQWLFLLRSTGSRRSGFRSCGTWAQELWLVGSRAQAR